jgi:hypothetical protein
MPISRSLSIQVIESDAKSIRQRSFRQFLTNLDAAILTRIHDSVNIFSGSQLRLNQILEFRPGISARYSGSGSTLLHGYPMDYTFCLVSTVRALPAGCWKESKLLPSQKMPALCWRRRGPRHFDCSNPAAWRKAARRRSYPRRSTSVPEAFVRSPRAWSFGPGCDLGSSGCLRRHCRRTLLRLEFSRQNLVEMPRRLKNNRQIAFYGDSSQYD